ncbi:MAG: aminotransferase class IV [Bacillota bacterium]
MLLWVNGRLVPAAEAAVSPFDAGFLLGYGVFETMRSFRGKVFRLEAHLERLTGGCRRLGLNGVPEHAALSRAVALTLQANGLTAARLRLTVTAGPESAPGTGPAAGVPAADAPAVGTPTVVVTAFPLSPEMEQPVFWTAGTCPRPVFSGDPLLSVKTVSRAGHTLARREALAAGYDEALLINERGVYTEGTVTNLFVVRGRVLQTPPLSDGLLPGLTRGIIKELAGGLGLEFREAPVRAQDMLSADEVFLTNTVGGLIPLAALDGVPLGAAVPGPRTVLLRQAYRALLTKEC